MADSDNLHGVDSLAFLKHAIDHHPEFTWNFSNPFSRGTVLKQVNSSDSTIFYVHSGAIRVLFHYEDQVHTVRLGYRGSFVTALDAFLTQHSSPYSIEVLKRTEISGISRQRFLKLVNSDQQLLNAWLELHNGLILQQVQREEDLLIASPKTRYLRVLKRSPRVFQEVPHKYIAQYLRMSPETLSRLQKS